MSVIFAATMTFPIPFECALGITTGDCKNSNISAESYLRDR